MILAHMQNPEILHGPKAALDYELPQFELPFQPPVLPVELYLQIEKQSHFNPDIQLSDLQNSPPTQVSFSVEVQNIHNKAIFDGLNEALDGLRPYGLRGPPVPWSSQGHRALTFKYGNTDALDDLLNDAEMRVITWSQAQAGKIMRGTQNKLDIDRQRQLRVAKMLVNEIDETNRMWDDFEMEETQIKLDLTDMIMTQMITEVINIMSKLKN